MYKFLIADDHPLFREAIINVIQYTFPDCEIHESDDLSGAAEIAKQVDDIDLILLDLDMPGMHGLNGLISLRNISPTTPVVIVSAEKNKYIVLQAITYGAVGFIAKSSPREHMGKALRQIINGSVYLPPDIIRVETNAARNITGNDVKSIASEMLSSLTRKQMLVLERLAKGESNKQIAFKMDIAETTVKTHVSAILRKLGVQNRTQAILSAGDVDFLEQLKRM